MDYETFVRRFGASVRTKNIVQPGEHAAGINTVNKRPYTLPQSSDIEREFIQLDPWEAEYLFILAERAKEGAVETGRFQGGSTFTMACANSTVPIWSIDLKPQDDEKLNSIFKTLGVGKNVNLIVGDSQHSRYDQIGRFDLLFIDADHSYEGCTADLENWFPLLSPGGHVILHDSYYGQPVMDAVNDFFLTVPNSPVIPAFRGSQHWQHHAGSMAHFIKL
jgi:predicted O-methyltransferase YrrM